jgi:predicted AlkP superfamily phosphohydrolase/phosphomutase
VISGIKNSGINLSGTYNQPMTELIVLGLDGATWDVLNPLIDEGRLPNIESVVGGGHSGTLHSTYPPITGPAWLSMATGQNPGKTGVFYFLNRTDPESFEFESFGSEKFEGESFWDILNHQGRSAGILNYPMLYPPYPIDGYMVSGLGSPEDETITYPSDLARELEQVCEGYELKVPYADPKYADRPEELADDLLATVETRERAILHLLEERPTDVFFGVVSATDWAQHYFWRHYDENHVLHEPSESHQGDRLVELWERVDELVGKVTAVAEARDAKLLLLSDHGFGPVNQTFHSNVWLEQEGLRVPATGDLLDRVRRRVFPPLKSIGTKLVSLVPQLNDLATSAGRAVRADPDAAIDWERSTAFAPRQNLTCGMLYFLSDDPSDWNRVAERLKSLSSEAIDVTVYKPTELYEGENIGLAPDLLFTVEGFECAVDPRLSADKVLSEGPPTPARSGGHRREGLYVASGPGIKQGESDANLLDIAPTVLYAVDEPIPERMDGSVLNPLFKESFRMDRTERREALSALYESGQNVTREDEGDVRERLEELGYL